MNAFTSAATPERPTGPATPPQPLQAPAADPLHALYDRIYATDLIYVKDCWKLCGDAHCCSFQRYKSRYRLIAKTPFQELPLLPGEYGYLQARGWLAQFEPFEHRVQVFEVGQRQLRYEAIVSRRPGCACDHATRPTICRLYPLLPRFDLEGRLIAVESTGIYEEMERIGGLPRACQVDGVPFAQMPAFLALVGALAASPLLRCHLELYRLTKAHVAERLAQRVAQTGKDVFQAFESALLRQALVEDTKLHSQLLACLYAHDARWPGWELADPATRTDTEIPA